MEIFILSFENHFLAVKSFLGLCNLLLIQTSKYLNVFVIFWLKRDQNAISDLQTKFQLSQTLKYLKFLEIFLLKVHQNATEINF